MVRLFALAVAVALMGCHVMANQSEELPSQEIERRLQRSGGGRRPGGGPGRGAGRRRPCGRRSNIASCPCADGQTYVGLPSIKESCHRRNNPVESCTCVDGRQWPKRDEGERRLPSIKESCHR